MKDELELISPDKKTKTGYLKDDFVVDDSIQKIEKIMILMMSLKKSIMILNNYYNFF